MGKAWVIILPPHLFYFINLQDVGATDAQVLGVLPFRDRWFGKTQAPLRPT
ncbi:hypothetical protein [Komarekiella delphini-convector]|uniref:hypothetical protein n=1 Tax=Komarekiella delphini-convector TaxID=3050158 RepID=UPI001786261A|nr:hypothetical protein [Komarekiella delphini-convector]